MSNENKAIIHRLIDEVWNQRKLDILDELVAPDAVIHSPMIPDLSRGPEGNTFASSGLLSPTYKSPPMTWLPKGIKWHSAGQLAGRTRGG